MKPFSTKTAVFLAALCAMSSSGFAENPICDNTEASEAYDKKCLTLGESHFMQFFKEWPTYSNGEAFKDSGAVSWTSQIQDIPQSEKRFSKHNVIYSVFQKGVYECDYTVLSVGDLDTSIPGFDNDDFVTDYFNCKYAPNGEYDTTFAVTEFQKKVDAGEVVLNALQGEFFLWKFYRSDGTLKFVGDINEGYCMNKSGMSKTKRVSNPRFCK